MGEKGKEDMRGRPWNEEEDKLVRSLVEMHGTKRWSLIASNLIGRTGKQCRERWHNQLDPAIKKDNWTIEEDRILLDSHRQLGALASLVGGLAQLKMHCCDSATLAVGACMRMWSCTP